MVKTVLFFSSQKRHTDILFKSQNKAMFFNVLQLFVLLDVQH